MTEETVETGRQVVARRERIIVESRSAIMDSGKFEHLGRVATMMANGWLMPETLTHTGSKGNRTVLPAETIVARAFMIASLADRWEMDPMAVMGCCSLVHNKLMFEGKLIAAVIEARVGVRLKYEFGKWDPKRLRVEVGIECADELLGVVVSAQFPDEDEPRTVEGYVAQWRTTGDNTPWGSPSNWRRQCRYRGAREWANAHSPGVILGVLTDDDIDALAARNVEINQRVLATAPQLEDAMGRAPAMLQDGEKVLPKGTAGDDPLAIPRRRGPGKKSAAAAQSAEADKDTKASATVASNDIPPVAADSGQTPQSPPTTDGPADHGDQSGANDTVSKGAAEPEGEQGQGEIQQAQTQQAQTQTRTRKSPPSSDASPAGSPDDVFAKFYKALAPMVSWLQIKRVIADLVSTAQFRDAEDGQNEALRAAYDHAIKVDNVVNPETDISFYRLWLVSGAAPKDKIRPTFRMLMKTDGFRALQAKNEAEAERIMDETEEAQKAT